MESFRALDLPFPSQKASADAAVVFQCCRLFEDAEQPDGLGRCWSSTVGWMPPSLGPFPRLKTSFLLVNYDDGAAVVPSLLVKVGLMPFCELWKRV